MKKASIISIGNELLNGQSVDTNSTWLSGKLILIGLPTVSCYTIGDDIDSIVRVMKLAAEDADFILVTGGLGPTDDDLTRQAIGKFLNAKLELCDEMLKKIENRFIAGGRKMSQKNKIQAYIPAGTKPISNDLGTAPGIFAQTKNKLFFAMPGVPSEMKQMFDEFVMGKLKEHSGSQSIVIKKIKCFGTGESNIAQLLGDLMHRARNPLINCTVSHGVITLHIIAYAENHGQAEKMAQKDMNLLNEKIGDFIYGTGDQTLAEVAGNELTGQKKTLAVAESCTGGLLSKLLTDIPGASEYFTYGWVTYSNQAKITQLDVSAELIEQFGAVSQQVAAAMAEGARKKANADFGVAITGIAGPAGGSKEKPVGLAYISVSSEKTHRTERFIFAHDRAFIRFHAALSALNMLRLSLKI